MNVDSCLICKADSNEIPLIQFVFKGNTIAQNSGNSGKHRDTEKRGIVRSCRNFHKHK